MTIAKIPPRFLGLNTHDGQCHDPKTLTNNDKTFLALSLCTTDTYKKDGEWHKKAPIWHNVLVFDTNVQKYAKDHKKGDRIEITGSLSYRPMKGENGYDIMEASIIATHIKPASLSQDG